MCGPTPYCRITPLERLKDNRATKMRGPDRRAVIVARYTVLAFAIADLACVLLFAGGTLAHCHSNLAFSPTMLLLTSLGVPILAEPLFAIMFAGCLLLFVCARRSFRVSWAFLMITSVTAILLIAPVAGYMIDRRTSNALDLNCDPL